jgi:hypothetical protein
VHLKIDSVLYSCWIVSKNDLKYLTLKKIPARLKLHIKIRNKIQDPSRKGEVPRPHIRTSELQRSLCCWVGMRKVCLPAFHGLTRSTCSLRSYLRWRQWLTPVILATQEQRSKGMSLATNGGSYQHSEGRGRRVVSSRLP